MDAPVSVALARLRTASVVPFTSRSSAFPVAASLRSLILTVITDARAPVAVRNHCHRLMAALESDNQRLVDESLVTLEQVAERAGYRLPPSNRIPARHSI
jgi:hypothetical protein